MSSEPDLGDDAQKRKAVALLRDRYREARDLVSSGEPYVNLEWILGVRGNPNQDAANWDTKTIEVVALWLQDLAVEVDRPLPPRPTGEGGASASPAYQTRQSVVRSLREATESFRVAFRRSS